MARVAKKSVGDANSKGKARAKAVSGQGKPNELNQEKLNKQKEKQSPKLTAPYFSLRNSIVRWALILLVLLVISVVVYSNHPIEGKNFLNNLSSLSFLKTEDARITSIGERLTSLETRMSILEEKDTIILRLKKRDEELSASFAKISTRVGWIEETLSGVNKSLAQMHQGDVIGETRMAFDSIRQRLKELKQNEVDIKIGNQTLEALEQRLRRLEKSSSVQFASSDMEARKKSAIFLAFNQLRDVVRLGESYERELAIFKGLVGGASSYKKAFLSLNDHAKTGVPTIESLRQELRDLAGTMVAESRAGSAKNWYSKLIAKLGMVVTIRRVDGAEIGSVEELVASAESQMDARELGKAINFVKSIGAVSNQDGSVVTIWLGRAMSRFAVDNALKKLNSHTASLLSRAIRE